MLISRLVVAHVTPLQKLFQSRFVASASQTRDNFQMIQSRTNVSYDLER